MYKKGFGFRGISSLGLPIGALPLDPTGGLLSSYSLTSLLKILNTSLQWVRTPPIGV